MGRLAVLALVLAACKADVPNSPPMLTDAGLQAGFADTLIGYRAGGATTTCNSALTNCDGTPLTGDCAADDPGVAALGPEDGAAFALDDGGRIEVAFRCGWIMRHPDPNTLDMIIIPDLRVVATGAAPPDGGTGGGPSAVVEVSYDGSTFIVLGPIEAGETSLSLTRIELEVARFVRIADRTGGGLAIDSVEAL